MSSALALGYSRQTGFRPSRQRLQRFGADLFIRFVKSVYAALCPKPTLQLCLVAHQLIDFAKAQGVWIEARVNPSLVFAVCRVGDQCPIPTVVLQRFDDFSRLPRNGHAKPHFVFRKVALRVQELHRLRQLVGINPDFYNLWVSHFQRRYLRDYSYTFPFLALRRHRRSSCLQ